MVLITALCALRPVIAPVPLLSLSPRRLICVGVPMPGLSWRTPGPLFHSRRRLGTSPDACRPPLAPSAQQCSSTPAPSSRSFPCRRRLLLETSPLHGAGHNKNRLCGPVPSSEASLIWVRSESCGLPVPRDRGSFPPLGFVADVVRVPSHASGSFPGVISELKLEVRKECGDEAAGRLQGRLGSLSAGGQCPHARGQTWRKQSAPGAGPSVSEFAPFFLQAVHTHILLDTGFPLGFELPLLPT